MQPLIRRATRATFSPWEKGARDQGITLRYETPSFFCRLDEDVVY